MVQSTVGLCSQAPPGHHDSLEDSELPGAVPPREVCHSKRVTESAGGRGAGRGTSGFLALLLWIGLCCEGRGVLPEALVALAAQSHGRGRRPSPDLTPCDPDPVGATAVGRVTLREWHGLNRTAVGGCIRLYLELSIAPFRKKKH